MRFCESSFEMNRLRIPKEAEQDSGMGGRAEQPAVSLLAAGALQGQAPR